MPARAGIIKDIRDVYGKKSYLSLIDIARYMGIDVKQARQLLRSEDVPYIQTGQERGKRYCVPDVAEMIFRRQVRR